MITIDVEANKNKKLPTNIDFMSPLYKCSNNPYIIQSPTLWVIEKNLYFLLRYSKEEILESKYIYKPSYLSFDKYGTVVLDYLLMYLNNCPCIEEFNMSTVVIPSYSAIVELCKDRFKNDKPELFKTIDW